MQRRSALVRAALLASIVLLLAAAVASGSRSVTCQAGCRALNAATIRALSFEGGLGAVVCDVTLNFSLARVIDKIAATHAGDVTGATVNEAGCRGGRARPLRPETRAPWAISYVSFTGTLPASVTGFTLDVLNVAFLVEQIIVGCLFRGTLRVRVRGASNRFEAMQADETSRIPLTTTLSGICPASGTVRGTAALREVVSIALEAAETFTPNRPRMDFIRTLEFREREKIVTFTYRGAREVTAGRAVLVGGDARRFGILRDDCNGERLREGGTCQVGVGLLTEGINAAGLDVEVGEGIRGHVALS